MMISDEEKRWLVVGIAMNKVAAPVLRDFIKQGMDTHYTNLDIYCSGLATPCTLKTLTHHHVSTDPCFEHLKFQNVNNNLQLYGMKKRDLHKYNYNINSSVDLAKLFLPDYLAEFCGFDESLDMSAILRLLGFNNPAPIFYSPNPLISIQLSADEVRENVRNTWGHCNVTNWTEVFFSDCFSKLKTLVRSLGLTRGMEKTTLDQLSDWETKGVQLCMGHAVDQNLLSLVQQDVKELVKNYKTTEESLAQHRVELTAMQNTVTSIQDQQSAIGAQLKEHDEQLAAVLEWKEQELKENEGIFLKLVSVEKMLSEALLIRVERVEKGLAETDNKVEQLEQEFTKTDNKVEQLEQEFTKTGDKVEQLEQEFAKTDDKLEQLEQGFAKTGDKVQRLEQGYAKTDGKVEQLEQGFAKTGDKVEQLEQGFAKTDGKVEQLEQGFAKTDGKVEQLEQGFAKTGDKVEQLEQGFAKTGDKVEQLEQGFAKTDGKVEQLEQGFAKTDGKVEQLEQGFTKTDGKVEQLEQGFAKTDDKVEQLEQRFAKTGGKVEQLEQGFAKVEKDVCETGNKVKQLEEAVRSQRMKENKPASTDETFDVKSCRSKLAEHYKRTATVPTSVWSKKSPMDIHQIYTRLSWVKEEQTPAGSSQFNLAHYTEVFTANKNGVVPKRILVQGQTGIGKSTFVKKLSVDWAKLDDETTGDTKKGALRRFEDGEDGHVSDDKEATFQDHEERSRSSGKYEGMSEKQKESLKKFELVLVINLKEVSKCRSLTEIVRCCSIFPEEETALVEGLLSYITKNQEKVLLVFDGYDEYRCGSNSEIYEIFRGKKLRNCCVLMTTRISKGDELREFKEVHAEITGFSEEDRVDFMIKVLGSQAAEAEELRDHLSRKKLTDLTRVPLLLLFFCTLWKKGKLKSFPDTKTKLYLDIVQYVLDYNQGKDSSARFGKVHDFKDILTEIGKVALDCLLKDDHVFEYDQLSASILCDESFIIGLLQVTEYAENLRPSGVVSFIHKSIQEFLAAWYIANSCVPDGSLGGIEQHPCTLEDFQAWENVFQFVCGLSDDGAVKVFQHLTSVRISDPTLDLSKIVPDVENETVVPLCDVTDRHERFSNVVYDSFQEVKSKAELFSHWFDCNGRIFLETTERPLPDLIPKVDDFTKLAHSRGAQVIVPSDLMLDKLLKFLDCWHKPISDSKSSEVFTVEDFLGKFEYKLLLSSFSSILCFRNGNFQFYLTGLKLFSDAEAKLFGEAIADSFPSPSANMRSEWSCLKFLTSLLCLRGGLSGQSYRVLGAAIRDCEHLKRIVVHECVDSVTDLLEHVRNPSQCSLEIGPFFIPTEEGNIQKCDLTTSGAVKLASFISMFDNIITLCLGLSNCCSAAVDTVVTSITHSTLERLELHGTRLTPAAVASLGRFLPEMSSLKVLQLTGVDGSILEAEEIEALFGGFNKPLPLSRLTLSGFSVRGCLSPLAKSLSFFPTLSKLQLEKLIVDEHDQCSLLQSFGFLPNLTVMKVNSKSLGYPYCCTTKVNTRRGYKLGDYKSLELNGISLTRAVAAALGRSLSEMPFLQELELTDVDGSILQVEEMEALFGRFNRTMPLCKLTFSGFRVGGCLAPLTKSFRFFPNLRELKLEKLNMDENDQCGLLESLPFIRNLTALKIQTRPLGDANCCTAELNTYDYFRRTASKSLTLKGIILTQATTAALGQSLPEMLSLRALEVTGVRPETVLQADEIEALFGRFNGVLPLYSLVFRDFCLTGSIGPLTKSLCFFPNLMELNLAKFDMDEHNLCGLLENLRFTPNLMELRVEAKTLDPANCRAAKVHTVGGFPLKTLKELILYGICLTPAVATVLGRILPEMSSLEECVLTGVDGSIVKAEEIEALFGGLNKTLPLHRLTFCFSVRGCLAPLIKSFRFLPNLRVLHLRGLNMDEHNLCGLIDSLRSIPNLKFLNVEGKSLDYTRCCTAELNIMSCITHKTLEQLSLYGISLTPVSAALLGRSLPEMSSLQVLELTGVDGSILQAKEMEALFGGFDKNLPLYRLTFGHFDLRGCLATLCESFRFFPNLRQLSLRQLNMDEQDGYSLLQNLRFIRNLKALVVQSEDQGDARCYTRELNTFGSCTSEIREKLHLNGISLTPAAAAALGRSLPEMSSLQVLEITGLNRRTLQVEEMEALFGGFSKTMPLCELTFSGFCVRGCLAPLIKSLRFFPSLRELRFERLNVDENDQCGLLKSFGFIGNLTEVSVHVLGYTDLVSFHYYTSKSNGIFDRLAGRVEKTLKLDGINLTPTVASVLGLLLPKMSSLQTLELSGVHRSILEAEEMELLFGRFNNTLPLHRLTLRGFSVRGCLSLLFRNLHFFPSLTELSLDDLDMGEHDCCFLNALCCKAEVNPRVCPAKVTFKNLEQLKLDRISLTPAAAVALGRSLPEMSSLQVLEITGLNRRTLQVEEMEALFGEFNKPMPLCQLILNGFSVRSCLAPLFRSLRFFPDLIELDLENSNMDEHDLRGLLESFQFIPNLQGLNLSCNPLGHAVTYIVPHVITLKKLRCLWIDQTCHSEEDLNYVRDAVQQALPELKIRSDLSSACSLM